MDTADDNQWADNSLVNVIQFPVCVYTNTNWRFEKWNKLPYERDQREEKCFEAKRYSR